MKGNEQKPHIGIFGRRNYGKSTLVNFLTGQQIAIVSDTPGTTTDPVRKTMEVTGVGPVVWVDTAGIDDEGELGQLRIQKSFEVLPQCDLAIILFSNNIFAEPECRIVEACKAGNVPFVLVYSLSDKFPPEASVLADVESRYGTTIIRSTH